MPPKAAHRRAAGGRHRADATARRSSAYTPAHSSSSITPELRRLLASGVVLGCVALGATAVAAMDSPYTQTPTGIDLTSLSDQREVYAEKQLSRSNAQRGGAATTSASPSPTATKKKPSPSPSPTPTKKTVPTPVAGLDQQQMNNAATIVKVGKELGLPKRALIIGMATAMQESDLYNFASDAVPESLDYPHQGVSVDHDSVGVFQQRPSQGWGTVANLMKPAYQARQFFERLADIDWENMALTEAAQTIQVSAFPDAYAKHESRATTIVNALT